MLHCESKAEATSATTGLCRILVALFAIVTTTFPLAPALADCNDDPKPNVDWSGCHKVRLVMPGADFSGGTFDEAFFTSTDLSNADFSEANLGRVELSMASLAGANLASADLEKAMEHEAIFPMLI